MTESTRRHERIAQREYEGFHGSILLKSGRPGEVFIPHRFLTASSFDLLIHFLGAGNVTDSAALAFPTSLVAVTINLGAGSSKYNDAFNDTTVFPLLLDSVRSLLQINDIKTSIKRIFLSGFSAGYGAIRRILATESNYRIVDGVLLLDGIHASYVPERKVLAEGGSIEEKDLSVFLRLARDASRGESTKRFLITHSEIFPGTFVSTTEAADDLLRQLGLKRTPVLQWGPLGMQQLSVAKAGHFMVLGFAGNSARDHGDHLHGLFHFLTLLSSL